MPVKKTSPTAARATSTTSPAEESASAAEETKSASSGQEGASSSGRKVRYTKELKRAQQAEEGLAKAAHRISNATRKGFATYLKLRKKSARKKKDGALVDAFLNVAKAQSEAMEEASPAVYDIAKAIDPMGSTGKQRRKAIKRWRKLRDARPPFFI